MTSTTKTGRSKTSHTTIERRYRTNLNARILALRRAVPALRILEKNTTTQTQGKGLTGATAPRWDFGELSSRRPSFEVCEPTNLRKDDVVNERGFVDGVKAARKNSKGVVLGKAVEYIK
jgi:Helix-loop-helix DNA-binding domain